MADKTIRAVIDTSDEVLRAGIGSILANAGVEVLRAVDSRAVVLVDHGRVADNPGARRLAVLEHADHVAMCRCLAAGVHGAILRRSSPAAFVDAVVTVHRGNLWFDGELLGALPWTWEPSSNVDLGGLTPREREVFSLVAAGLPNSRIATRLGITVRTVKLHVSNILAKLDVRSRAEVVVYAARGGRRLFNRPRPPECRQGSPPG